ncbi:hypothetical protein PPERSA_00972 [Pseudocohnilembus persalinus]|uniref:Cullin neddylation domain-containing protein n=1 Tax=Pseudocohnilembus persalinus TaxID=266149 RepID=A0A0V0R8N6_PSEPJ|nr:hypothetical protein PPERSA_00972 [Pseudocohnilembus persalinus]|eukprot:KRX10802.1 hypothetical protein PPERSA_00972 [Pseudocohnilembus persalinus]
MCSTTQIIILFFLQEFDSIVDNKYLQQHINIPENEYNKAVYFLKKNNIVKEQNQMENQKKIDKKEKEIDVKQDPNQKIYLNKELNLPSLKPLNIKPKGKIKKQEEEIKLKLQQEEAQKKLKIERSYIIQSKIVVVMKSRKTLNIQELVQEVTNLLVNIFQVQIKDIKQQVDQLIERDYLKRDTQNFSILHYQA